MNTNIHVNEEALQRHIDCITDMTVEDVRGMLQKRLRLVLKEAPVTITAYEAFKDKTTSPPVESINKRELCAIFALMNYASWNQNMRPETVQTRLEAKFEVEHVGLIPRTKFLHAVDYLIDLHALDEDSA